MNKEKFKKYLGAFFLAFFTLSTINYFKGNTLDYIYILELSLIISISVIIFLFIKEKITK
jgi:hypothetical protein